METSTITKKRNAKESDKVAFFVVEKIKAFKWNKKVPEYYIKWKGYPESQCTWEPIEHLLYLIDDIRAYNIKNNITIDTEKYISLENKPDIYNDKQPPVIKRPPKRKKKPVPCPEKVLKITSGSKINIIGLSSESDINKCTLVVSEEINCERTTIYEIDGLELLKKYPDTVIDFFESFITMKEK